MKTKVCPVCGKKMIKRYKDYVLMSYPPQYPWYWWCGCGHEEPGGVERGIAAEEMVMAAWREINGMEGE